MIYTNLLLFLVAIFLFSIGSVPETTLLPPWLAALLFILAVLGFDRVCRRVYRRSSTLGAAGYFQAEKKLSILSLAFFGASLYLCDVKYYLSVLSFHNRLPTLMNVAGLGVFLLFLSLMWRAGRRNYEYVFDRRYTSFGFILSNIKANLPIFLPWVILSVLFDLLALLPLPGLHRLLISQWGDLFFFVLFLGFVVVFFPPLVRRLWGCRPLPDGELKRKLVEFCKRQDFTAELYIWPLFEGRVLTAGVMGIVPGLRYILLTPAIIETMNMEELESVMAHEIGHVKRHHLLLYIVLIGGFSVFAGLFMQPFGLFFISRQFVVDQMIAHGINPKSLLSVSESVGLLLFLVLYFRFLFGYYIRNFERQADLHALKVIGNGRALISAFEKIARMGGNSRDEKNWHHFGIGERIDCLERAEQSARVVAGHDRKVRYSLLAYVGALALSLLLVSQVPTATLGRQFQVRYTEGVLLNKAKNEPNSAVWQQMIGELLLKRKQEAKALAAYRKAYFLNPSNPYLMNNLAWLLLTSHDLSLREPEKALTLAQAAAAVLPKGYVLDTLATAYWANGQVKQAVETEKKAMATDPQEQSYYQSQAALFLKESYAESVSRERREQEQTKSTEG